MLLSRGEKESARHGIEHLLTTAANDWNVHLVAGLTLRIDGMYDEALDQFNTSLSLNPPTPPSSTTTAPASITIKTSSNSPATRWRRASRSNRASRCCASRWATSKCVWAICTRRRNSRRVSSPTRPACASSSPPSRCATSRSATAKRPPSFIQEETLAAAEADSEMAYRLATYFAVEGDESKRCTGFAAPSIWATKTIPGLPKTQPGRTSGHSDFERILEDLKKTYRRNQKSGSACWPRSKQRRATQRRPAKNQVV